MTKAESTRRKSYGPDFLVIGPHKTGTTWLYHQLQLQEAIQTTPFKEYHYLSRIPGAVNFSPNDPFFEWTANTIRARKKLFYQGKTNMGIREALVYFHQKPSIRRYANIFPKHNRKIVGEVAPETYMIQEDTIRELYHYYPSLKIIIGLRNPIWSDASLAQMINRLAATSTEHSQNKNQEKSLPKAIKSMVLSMNTLLDHHLEKWLSIFPEKQVHAYDFTMIADNPNMLLNELSFFLDVDFSNRSELQTKVNAFPYSTIDIHLKNQLIEKHRNSVEQLIQRRILPNHSALFTSWLKEM